MSNQADYFTLTRCILYIISVTYEVPVTGVIIITN
jgi:hypothetical protein